jgi:hypothetical protein
MSSTERGTKGRKMKSGAVKFITEISRNEAEAEREEAA